MSELVHQGPLEGGGSADTMASSLVGPLEASGSELAAAAADSLNQRRGSFGVKHGAAGSMVAASLSPQTSASDLLLHAQSSCSLQGLLASRTEAAAAGAVTPSPAITGGSPSLTSISSGEGEERNGIGEQQQHVLKQDFSFNALGEPLSSRSQSLSKKWTNRESGSNGLVGVEVETHSSSSSSTSSSSNSISSSLSNSTGSMWSPFERDPAASPVLLPFALAAATNGAAANAAATAAAAAAAAAGKSDFTPSPDTPAAQPRTLRAAVRGGLERLMRFSAWPQREALPSAPPAPAAPQVVPSSSGMLPWASDASRGPPEEGGALGLMPQGGPLAAPYRPPPLATQDGTVPFGVAHPEARAHVVLLMELQRMRNELTQLHLQQQRQPSIVIQNHTAVAAKAEAPQGPQESHRRNWVSDWASTFFASRLNRVLFVCGVGVSCLMVLEHWRHSWRMAQLKSRMDANLLLRGLQILEDVLGLRR